MDGLTLIDRALIVLAVLQLAAFSRFWFDRARARNGEWRVDLKPIRGGVDAPPTGLAPLAPVFGAEPHPPVHPRLAILQARDRAAWPSCEGSAESRPALLDQTAHYGVARPQTRQRSAMGGKGTFEI